MPYTHDFELTIADNEFEGEVELSSAGAVSYEESSTVKMSQRIKGMFEIVLDELAKMPAEYTDLKKFELTIKAP